MTEVVAEFTSAYYTDGWGVFLSVCSGSQDVSMYPAVPEVLLIFPPVLLFLVNFPFFLGHLYSE